jgi:hypothetical protein
MYNFYLLRYTSGNGNVSEESAQKASSLLCYPCPLITFKYADARSFTPMDMNTSYLCLDHSVWICYPSEQGFSTGTQRTINGLTRYLCP